MISVISDHDIGSQFSINLDGTPRNRLRYGGIIAYHIYILNGAVDLPTRMGGMIWSVGSQNRIPKSVPNPLVFVFVLLPAHPFFFAFQIWKAFFFFPPGVNPRGDIGCLCHANGITYFTPDCVSCQRRHILVSCTGIIVLTVGVPEMAVRLYTGSSNICKRNTSEGLSKSCRGLVCRRFVEEPLVCLVSRPRRCLVSFFFMSTGTGMR